METYSERTDPHGQPTVFHAGAYAAPRELDKSAGIAFAFAFVVSLLSSSWPGLIFLMSLMPADSCESGSCGVTLRGVTVVLGVGLLAEIALLIAVALLRYRDQRLVRWLCAFAAPALPWLALLSVGGI